MIQLRGFGSGFAAVAFCSVMLALAGCDSADDAGKSAAPREPGNVAEQATPATRITRTDATPAPTPAPAKPRVEATPNHPKAAPGKTIIMGEVTSADGQLLGTSVTVGLNQGVSTGMPDNTNATSVTVGADGRYRFEIDTPQFASLTASGKGLLMMVTAVYDPNGGSYDGKTVVRDFKMERGVEVSGRLVDVSGAPLTGSVTGTWPVDMAAMSNAKPDDVRVIPSVQDKSSATDGFSLTVASGEVTLVGSAEGYGPVEKTTTAPATGIEIRLGEGASIEGMVLMQGTREGVSSATVQVSGKDMTPRGGRMPIAKVSAVVTDPQGMFHLRGMSNGEYALMAKGEKLFPFPGNKGLGTASVSIADGASTSGIELMLYPGHTVSGRVTNKETGEPIAGVEISQNVYANAVKAETDSDGRYRLFPVTNVQLVVAKEGFRMVDSASSRRAQMFSAGPVMKSRLTVELGDELDVSRDFEMAESITISGKVTRKNGDIIPDASVSLFSSGGGGMNSANLTRVNNDGTFKMEVVPNITGRVKAVAPGYARGISEMVEVLDTSVSGVVVILNAGGSLGGVVVDPQGKPVPEAKVNATAYVSLGMSSMGETVGDTVSDAEGRFALLNLPVGSNSLTAHKKGFASSVDQKEEIEEDKTRSDVRLELRPPHFIAGRVTDTNKKPIAGASVSFYSQSGGSGRATTDEDGKYRVDDLAEGTYTGNCNKQPQGNAQKQGVKVDRDDVDFILGEEKKGDLTVIGKVLDWKSRDPIKDFKVTPEYNQVKKSPDKPGEFTLQAQANVTYTLTVSAPDYQPSIQSFSADTGMGSTKEITFLLGPGGTIIGRVVNKADKAPIPGAKLTMMSSGSNFGWVPDELKATMRNATTTADGQFVFEKAPAGSVQIEVKVGEGKAPASKTITVEHDKIADAGDIEIGTGGAIRVKVVRDPGDSPVEGADINIMSQMAPGSGTRGSKKTDAQGTALFENLAPGPYSVSDQNNKIHGNTVVNGEATVEVVLRLGGGTLTGKITKEGKPISAGGISLSRQGGEASERVNMSAQVEGEGKYEIKNLPAGTYRATVMSYEEQQAGRMSRIEETLEVRGSGVQVKDFEFPAGHLVGRVTDEAGNPVSGATITVVPLDPGSAYASMFSYGNTFRSGDRGEFDLAGITPGDYTISAKKTGEGVSKPEKVEVPAKGNSRSVTLKLEKGNAGTVVSSALNYTSGAPIPEAWCYLTSVETGGRYDHSGKRGPDGLMTIPDIPIGRYRVEVGSWGFSMGYHDIEVKAGETVRLDDVLYDAGALRLTVTGAGGAPIPGAPCSIAPDDPQSIEKPQSGKADPNGLWVARGLFPGNYTATVKLADGKTATAKMTIVAHEVVEVTVSVP
ncbi:hypothetical protein CVU37_11455 [candidate division BRC1 bacterium HGW-BRC1-1]|jgi:protocatechuate 3,4-dioxygenase beta subunit|nr:MAG: hypothetical protein CVU37_11455 [candidate division BRC1 bacterium HGW-BRC1-1]